MKRKCLAVIIIMVSFTSFAIGAVYASEAKEEAIPKETVQATLPLSASKPIYIEVKGSETYEEAEKRTKDHGSVEEIAHELCSSRGFEKWCADDLIAMAIAESGVQASAVGDNGLSHGYFQIQIALHNVKKECATDFRCSADWTLSNLVKNGYPKYRTIAIRRHNGWGEASKRYAANVKEISENLAGR